jgi:hypothetical protein
MAAESDPIFLRFEVFGGPGLHFLTLKATVDESGAGYSIIAEAETRNVADLLVDLRSRLEVRGRIAAGALAPRVMHAETHRRGADFYTRIDYGPDGTVTAVVTPPPRSVTPVSPDQMRGTIDQLSTYLALARNLSRRGSCALTLAVFDGRRRYDLNFADATAEALPELTFPTQLCRMSRQRIAGFPLDRGGASKATDEGKLSFARLLPGDFMVPVRIEFASEFGTFTAELAELRGHGVQLQLRE